MGLDVCLYHCPSPGNSTQQELPRIEKSSQLHPNHLFKIGYFRSSYNEHGFNSVMENLGLPTLYDIFSDATRLDDYYVRPDWKQSKVLVEKALKQFKKLLQTSASEYKVTFVNSRNKVSSRREALAAFLEEVESHNRSKGFPAYLSKNGTFYLDKPLKVRGIIGGKGPAGFQGVYLVYDAEEDAYLWYLQALEIVRETIDWVLKQTNPREYVLGWGS